MNKTKKEIYVIIAVVALLSVFTAFASAVTTPKRMDYGSTWGRFLQEEENSIDAMFFGSSITYCDVIPAEIWDGTGITSYVMAGPEQTIPISYYYIRQSCKTQTPKIIFLEVTGMFFECYQDYTKVNVGYMPRGINRLSATLLAAERSEQAGLFFPLYNYHSRWDALERVDVKLALTGYPADDLAGYTFLGDAVAMYEIQPRNEALDRENYDRNLQYLQKTADFCEENDIMPVFYVAPTYLRLSDENSQMLEADIAKLQNVRFFDFNEGTDTPEFDPERDWFDLLHFNYRGAEKFSAHLGTVMINELGLAPSADADSGLWSQRIEAYRKLKDGVN